MTADEKLAVIAGNLRNAAADSSRADDIVRGTLYELAELAASLEDHTGAADTARLVIPDDSPEMLAQFCKLYAKYYGDRLSPIRGEEPSDKSDTVAIPEIARLTDTVRVLCENGIELSAEYGDSFASCAEDVEYGNSRYVLMPVFDPEEGRIRSFDKLRVRYGLKIHCILYVPGDNGGEYGYQLCGLGLPDDSVFPHHRVLFTAETKHDPLKFIDGILLLGAKLASAEIGVGDGVNTVTAVLNTERLGDYDMRGLLMYMNSAADITIDGCYAEIHHKSKGF
ncbi:MAG: hypothetical protein IJ386_00305 [Clostridia bacterium]|nr:hypothetical protein [Clostridia bacterium]